MPFPAIKICGLTQAEDVRLAAGLGAWAVGLVFAPSPRRVEVEASRRLASEARAAPLPIGGGPPLVIGVFGDVPAEEVVAVAAEAGLDGVQLHGRWGPGAAAVRKVEEAARTTRTAAAAIAARPERAAVAEVLAPPVRTATGPGAGAAPPGGWKGARSLIVIQAIPVPPEGADPGALAREAERARAQGADLVLLDTGTGVAFGGTGRGFPWEAAVEAARQAPLLVAGGIGPDNVVAALRRSGAWGVDVSSAIEISPGVKDAASMRLLFERAATGEGASAPGVRAAEEWPPPPRPQGRAAAQPLSAED